jgi:2-oxoisovalerate dehydrogenase E2 component (dihydrolipoyl transacylase)
MTVEKSFPLPDLGEGLADAELMHWHVAVGDEVTLNQVIAEVETAKAAVELPSPYAGRVVTLHVGEGETVNVGTPIITFAVDAPAETARPAGEQTTTERQTTERQSTGRQSTDRDAADQPTALRSATGQPAEERVPVLVGYGATAGTGSRRIGRPRRSNPPPSPAARPPVLAAAPPRTLDLPTTARPLAKPLVRKLARDNGLDLTTVIGSGPGGAVTRQDVMDRLAAPRAATQTTATPTTATETTAIQSAAHQTAAGPTATRDREERVPIRGVRKATAQAMVRSAFTAPTVTEFITVDVTPTMHLLKQLRDSAYLDGTRLTMLAFVAKATVAALRRHPTLNSSWDEAAQEIVLKRYVNLGIATATPRGLMVPNLKDVGDLDLIGLARALQGLTETAREGRATPADLTGGTISITNVGVFGVDCGTPILNPGEAAILCLGAVREQPWVHQGELAVRWVTTLSLSFDHRLVDGEQGSRYLADIAETLATG